MTVSLPAPLDYPIYSTLLCLLQECRFATTHQLARFTVDRYKSEHVAHRQTARHLNRLVEMGYALELPRTIGGRQRGSSPKIWICSAKGHKAVTGRKRRPRVKEHSAGFVRHTLAVTESRVHLAQLARAEGFEVQMEGEPDCWRSFLGAYGQRTILRPDLYVHIRSTDREFFALVEVDLATESPGRVLRRCSLYDTYFRTGLEQRSIGVFPVVIWIVPGQRRRAQLDRYIREDQELVQQMFHIVTQDGFADIVRRGLAPTADLKGQYQPSTRGGDHHE